MKKVGQTRKRAFLFLWCFGMAVQLCFLRGACSETTSLGRRAPLKRNIPQPPHFPTAVKLNIEDNNKVVIDNGLVRVTLKSPEGYVLGISYNGIDNVLEAHNEHEDRGYLDVVWQGPAKKHDMFQRIHGTKFSVIEENENQVEVSFLRTWTSSMEGSVPMSIDKRYILLRGNSGYYSYAIFERPEGFPATVISQIRIVYKLQKEMFHYMAVSEKRQRKMPTAKDRETGQPLAYPEAVLLTKAEDPEIRGEVDDKYQYSSLNQENCVHGWMSSDSESPTGFWVITPSNEFRNAGPIKQDLTSHVGPTTLAMFVSTHYAGKDVMINFDEGETYKKVFGPVFVYLNSVSSKKFSHVLWSDAVRQYYKESSSWPYNFPRSPDFILPRQRGTVAGRLLVRDWYLKAWRILDAKFAYVGLALPGGNGSWQKESKGYQFWTRADWKGSFTIRNVVPGDYNLYAWVPGFIGDYRYNVTVTVKPGGIIVLGSLVYNPPRNGPTIWEIGFPDRSAAEFYVPDPDPTLVNKLYLKVPKDKFRQYGLWERYADLYPNNDLVYKVGVDNYDKHWFFAHVTRKMGNKTYQPTTWQIKFELKDVPSKGNYTLHVALASATDANLQIWFNDGKGEGGELTTRTIGRDNAIARHGIHGLYRLFSFEVASDGFVKGMNTLYLKQIKATGPFQGLMYDYLRLETPPPPTSF